MKYRLGDIYVDKGSRKHVDDQFLRWINIDGSGMLNSPGVRPLPYTTKLSQSGLPAYLILVTHDIARGTLNPWDDIVDLSCAEILYWGDARAGKGEHVDDFRGNMVLRRVYDYVLSGKKDLAPPILHFSKPKQGLVQFNGLCVLDKLDISWFDDHGRPVQNYHARLTVLNCAEVCTDWLHHRAVCGSAQLVDEHSECPQSWLKYKKGKKDPIDIWVKKIRSESQQLPARGSEEDNILSQLADLDPYFFEKVVVSMFRQMDNVTHHVARTRAVSDGGFDFYGTFRLPRPLGYEIAFRGEVKRYSRTTAVDPKSISRLVARLNRCEYGIFVTTSYFTKQAQREVLSDDYPVHLVAGSDLVHMLKHLNLVSQGAIRADWLEAVGSGSV